MRTVALFFAGLGILSGLLFWVGALMYSSALPRALVIGPVIMGAVVLVTHALNLRKLRQAASRLPRALLVGMNLLLFAFFVLGLLYLVDSRSHSALFLVCFAVVFMLPFALIGIYFVAFYKSPHDV